MTDKYPVRVSVISEEPIDISDLVPKLKTVRLWHETHDAYRQLGQLADTMQVYSGVSDFVREAAQDVQKLLYAVKYVDDRPMLTIDFDTEDLDEETGATLTRLPVEFEVYVYEDELRSKRRSIFKSGDNDNLHLDAVTFDGGYAILYTHNHVEIPYQGRKIWVDFSLTLAVDTRDGGWCCRSSYNAELQITDIDAGDLSKDELDAVTNNLFCARHEMEAA